MRKIKYIITAFILLTAFTFNSCKKFVDIIPDNVADIDMIFNLRTTAERYLFTLYSYLPKHGSIRGHAAISQTANPAFLAGNEFTYSYGSLFNASNFRIAYGNQNTATPISDYWNTRNIFLAIRDCNTFIDNIHLVPDMREEEKVRWKAEAKFLKAYYHFWLFKLYGPIPIIDKNSSLSATTEEIRVDRRPIDEVVDYIAATLDDAAKDLPPTIISRVDELGRATAGIALSLKAYLLVTAASPLFNGNQEYQTFRSPNGHLYFNQTYSQEKWTRAANAAKAAIDLVEANGSTLFYFQPTNLPQGQAVSDPIITQLNIRNSVTDRNNAEVIWGDPNSRFDNWEVGEFLPRLDATVTGTITDGSVAPTLNVALDFYSKNGVPIDEDLNWDYTKRFDLRQATIEDSLHLEPGYTTAYLHFDREVRFYASLGFDGGKWYGQGRYNEANQWIVYGKRGQIGFSTSLNYFSMTGYYPKKLVHYETTTLQSGVQHVSYAWPVIRLADLYLLYAEALNESNGPTADVYKYLDLVRKRAGLKGVVESWANYSRIPNKPNTQDGLREIIRQERTVEFALEGHRFWDQRRWKTAFEELNRPIIGWDNTQTTDLGFYRVTPYVQRSFTIRDYFWPLPQTAVLQNPKLGQNFGW